MTADRPRNDASAIRYGSLAVDDDEWIHEFLRCVPTGVLALPTDAEPHVLTQLFVYDADEGACFFHGAQGGRAYDIVAEAAPIRASFSASEMGRVLPAQKPVNFNVEYGSVVARGEVSLVEERPAKFAVLERFMEKFAPQLSPEEDYDPIAGESVARTAVYRFDVESWTAKHGEKPDSFPGAFEYDPDASGAE